MPLQSITNPADLLSIAPEDTPYLFQEFISVDKGGERRLSKKKLHLLQTVDPVLEKILHSEEKVFFVTQGVRSTTFEQFLIGWVAYYYNQMAFAFTSDRILLIQIKNRRKLGVYLGSIEYADLRSAKPTILGNFRLKFTNGKSLLFSRMPRRDRKHLKTLMASLLAEAPKEKITSGKAMQHLCPSCFDSTEKVIPSCLSCETEFKRPRTAAIRSLIMPGLGDLYLGSKFLGTFELLFMLFIWGSMGLSAADDLSGGEDPTAVLAGLLIVFLIIHPMDALKSHYMGRKGLIPKG